MQRDRFLIGILASIIALIVLALVLFFVRQGDTTPIDDSTPEGVVQAYILALQQQDYRKAYAYLADGASKPSLSTFQQPFLTYQSAEITNTPVEVGETTLDAQVGTAIVQVTFLRGGRGFLEDVYREVQAAQLVRQGDAWKISLFAYPYWSYDWTNLATPAAVPTVTSTP